MDENHLKIKVGGSRKGTHGLRVRISQTMGNMCTETFETLQINNCHEIFCLEGQGLKNEARLKESVEAKIKKSTRQDILGIRPIKL